MKPYLTPIPSGAPTHRFAGLAEHGAIQFVRQWQWRESATRIGRRSFWLGFGACLIVTNLALYLGPRLPRRRDQARGRCLRGRHRDHGCRSRVARVVVLCAWASISPRHQGQPDQPVVTNGRTGCSPPQLRRGLAGRGGIAVTAANWVSVAVFVVAWLAIITWRIHIEETDCCQRSGKVPLLRRHHKR